MQKETTNTSRADLPLRDLPFFQLFIQSAGNTKTTMSCRALLFSSQRDDAALCLLAHARNQEDALDGFLPDENYPPVELQAMTLEEWKNNQHLLHVAALLCNASLLHPTNSSLLGLCMATQGHPDICHEAHLLLSVTTSKRLSPVAHAIINCKTELQSRMAAAAFLSQLHRQATHPALAIQAYQFFGMEMFGAILHSRNMVHATHVVMDSEVFQLRQL